MFFELANHTTNLHMSMRVGKNSNAASFSSEMKEDYLTECGEYVDSQIYLLIPFGFYQSE